MRRNPSTVVVLAGPLPGEVLTAVGRSMNVTLTRPEDSARDDLEAAAAALQRAGRATSPYALVAADPLAAVAAGWREMWDVTRQPGPAGFEQEAARALAAWRAGRFELPDYYLVLAPDTGAAGPAQAGAAQAGLAQAGPAPQVGDHRPDFHLGPLRSARAHRVVPVAAAEPAQLAAVVLNALGSLRHGPWWPGLDEVIETARRFYPDGLTDQNAAALAG